MTSFNNSFRTKHSTTRSREIDKPSYRSTDAKLRSKNILSNTIKLWFEALIQAHYSLNTFYVLWAILYGRQIHHSTNADQCRRFTAHLTQIFRQLVHLNLPNRNVVQLTAIWSSMNSSSTFRLSVLVCQYSTEFPTPNNTMYRANKLNLFSSESI